MKIIDIRSDTVTMPTPEMRKVMAEADVGDDVYHEDPTINRLEEKGAELMGKEEGIFMPSGTMANACAIMGHCRRGDEVLCGQGAHSFFYETGAGPALAGAQFYTLPGGGMFTAGDMKKAVKPLHFHFPRTSLVCVENTMNKAGGRLWDQDEVDLIVKTAHELNLKAHLDGARIFNAQTASGTPAARLARGFDSVSFCLSKGLGAPVGSVLCGSAEFIHDARRWRKMCGGGMRQAGILAAAGLYALENNVDRLKDDHALAKKFARALADIPAVEIDLDTVETNIFGFFVPENIEALDVQEKLKEKGVLINILSEHEIRVVTHMNLSEEDVDEAVDIIKSVLETC